MAHVLIIAYGNPLRSDDGVAWKAAEALQGRLSSDKVEILTVQQLGPEFAESASQSQCVIFVDAASDGNEPGTVQIREMSSGSSSTQDASRFCHALPPASILGLAKQLYGAQPQAFSATITGADFEHGESLSPIVENALPGFVARIEELVQSSLRARRTS